MPRGKMLWFSMAQNLGLQMNVPCYRWPTASQVNNIVQNVCRKERLLNDPLLAIGLFAKKNKDKIF